MDSSNKRGSAKDEPTAANAETATTTGLDAGGHEPAPESKDPEQDEARDSIQAAFDSLGAMHPDEKVWDEANRRAEQEPAKGATPEGEELTPEH
jgi:hypothetical protein